MKTFKEFLNEGINDKGLYKAVFLGGTPGSGKSYVQKQVKDGTIEPRIVNTDKFIEFLANKRNIDIGPGFDKQKEEFKDLVTDSKQSTKNQLAGFINGMLPMIIDGTSANLSNLLQRNGTLEFFGYDTAMVWVNTSLETSLKRAAKRARSVPEDFIRKVFAQMEKNKAFYRSKFSTFVEVDNNDGELTDKLILKVFQRVSGFFNSDVKNPVGIRNKERIIEAGAKEMVPTLLTKAQLNTRLGVWFKKE